MSFEAADKPSWYVIHTKTNQELLAASLLEERHRLEVYLPEVLQQYRGKIQLRPLFPRYLFVQADLATTEVTAINFTPGVLRLVAFGSRPLPLKPEVVSSIREEVNRLNAEGGLPRHKFKAGDLIRLKQGPLQGLEAVFVKHLPPSDRVVVLLEFLGRQNEIEVDISAIERTQMRRRGTRGRGRKIRYAALR